MTDDLIRLTGLRVHGRHGVYAEERRTGQPFVIDVELRLSLEAAAATDEVAGTVHYGELAQAIAQVVGGEPVALIETLADRIVDVALADPRVAWTRVTVHKPEAPIPLDFADVAVVLERFAEPHGADLPLVIALGSNLGDRGEALGRAVAAIGRIRGVHQVAASPVFETVALTDHGYDAQKPPYLNQVLTARTTRTPEELLTALLGIEHALGRVRTEHWGDRVIDLDLIAVGSLRRDDPQLELPHPRAHERRFVLEPWLAVDPDAELPGRGRVADLLAALPALLSVRGACRRCVV